MDFSSITDCLLVGTTPDMRDYERLHAEGVRLVINMRLLLGHGPSRPLTSMKYLRLRTFDSPLAPIPAHVLLRGAYAALSAIQEGDKVYVHCSRGRHRSVAMGAAILIAQGSSPEAAMKLLKRRRPVADPDARHIRPRILEFAEAWLREQRST